MYMCIYICIYIYIYIYLYLFIDTCKFLTSVLCLGYGTTSAACPALPFISSSRNRTFLPLPSKEPTFVNMSLPPSGQPTGPGLCSSVVGFMRSGRVFGFESSLAIAARRAAAGAAPSAAAGAFVVVVVAAVASRRPSRRSVGVAIPAGTRQQQPSLFLRHLYTFLSTSAQACP